LNDAEFPLECLQQTSRKAVETAVLFVYPNRISTRVLKSPNGGSQSVYSRNMINAPDIPALIFAESGSIIPPCLIG
jgi:hypothetical protein